MWRLSSRLMLFGILLGLVSFGCATKAGPSSYWIEIPTMSLAPIFHKCWARDSRGMRQPTRCTTVLEDDWHALVAELKAACLANGQEPEQCQAIMPPEDAF